MRDFDRVREKIDIRLEPRQVVGLAVVTALFCGGLFAGGYMLGVRSSGGSGGDSVMGRLASIDAFGGTRAEADLSAAPASEALGEVEFMFPSALGARPARQRPAPRPVRLPEQVVMAAGAPAPVPDLDPSEAPPPAEAPEEPRHERVVEERPRPERVERVVEAPRPRPTRPEPRVVEPIEPRSARPVAPVAPQVAAPAPMREVLPDIDEDAPDRGNRYAEARAAAPAPDAVGRFTVQLKTLEDRDEAAAYAEELRRAGYQTRIVPGDGRYSIHLGKFPSREAARAYQRRFRQESGRADAGFVTEL